MHTYQQLKDYVNKILSKQTFDKTPKTLFQPIKYILSIGGKRLRPVLTLMSCELFGGNIKDVIYPALGLEIFHNFTLLHDDVMDKSFMRRGRPTVHQKWNSNIAILSGDAMSITSYQYITRCKEKHLSKVLEIFNQTAVEVCQGQQLDMEFEQKGCINIHEYLTMIKHKTAVLFGCSTKIGSILADSPVQEQNRIYDFGVNLGIAFQLQDDYLDSFGDKKVFGKNIGGDILANKKTYLLTKTLETIDSKTKNILKQYLQNHKADNPQKKIDTIIDIYKKMNIDVHIKMEINKYLNKSLKILYQLPIGDNKKNHLLKLINQIEKRNK